MSSPLPQIVRFEVAKLKHNRMWMREGKVDQEVVNERAQSLKIHGQKSLITVCGDEVIDGNYRLLAARAAGLTHLDGVLITGMSEAEMLEAQFIIDAHRLDASATQRARTLAAIQERRGCTTTELAARMRLTQPTCTKYLAVDKASPSIKVLLDQGRIDLEKAYMLTQTPDPALIELAPTMSREQLRQRIKSNGKPAAKASSIHLTLPPGSYVVTLKGPEFSMDTLLQLLLEASKQLKRAIARGHDLDSVEAFLRRSAKPQPPQ